LMPLIHNKVVVSRSLHAAKLQREPTVVIEPSELGGYYVAESPVDLESLPTSLQRLPGSSVKFFDARADCRAKLGTIAAWAWANAQGAGWKPGDGAFNAERAFRDGDAFLVADIDDDCPNQSHGAAALSLPDRFRTWQVRALSEQPGNDVAIRVMQRGLAALESEPGLAVANAAYEGLRRSAPQPLPRHWWLLPRSYIYWSLATDGEGALLIAELQAAQRIANQNFAGAWLGIWCIGTGGRLESLSPDYVPHELEATITSYTHHLEVAGAPDEMPLILYSNYALRPRAGRYDFYRYGLEAPR
jgi:hypothetical protein